MPETMIAGESKALSRFAAGGRSITTVEVIMAGAGVKPSEAASNSGLMRAHRKFFSGGALAP